MDKPIKIIWKYKNSSHKIQYNIYIFVGNVSKMVMKILEKIKNLNIYDMLVQLEKSEYRIMEKEYGNKWFLYFYNFHHINNIFSNIRDNTTLSHELTEKYGSDWYKTNISEFKFVGKNIFYSYESLIHESLLMKMSKKERLKRQIATEIDKVDYHIHEGGSNETGLTFLSDEEDEEVYEEENILSDKENEKISESINKVLETDVSKKVEKNMVPFDITNDENIYDTEIKDVFNKNYIVNDFIYYEDTIKTIKNKICHNLKMNDRLGGYLLPTRQYLWSCYMFDNDEKKISIGHKWIRFNELLQIDIEPKNNIKIYENLMESLENLKVDIKRIKSKIRREDDMNLILSDYEDYILNNEIYMVDLYNELGYKYTITNQNGLKNLMDVYLHLYFPYIREEELKDIIEFLNNNSKNELLTMQNTYGTISNDLNIENEIINIVENEKKNRKQYTYMFGNNYILQAVIHLKLRLNKTKVDLFRIFNDFIPTKEYLFIQYQQPDHQIIYKFHEEEIKKLITKDESTLSKWFENAPNGIRFKINNVKEHKIITINMNETGMRIEYKTHLKEIDEKTIVDVRKSYQFVRDLLLKINEETKGIKYEIPEDDEFKIAFINSIQKFQFKDRFIVNHNDLSNFSRLFYPYIALVIDPRKRTGRLGKDTKSKYGTYLRYKRISNYENFAKIEQRILYFIKNYEFTDKQIIGEIARQFNITEEKAKNRYENVKERNPNIKKSRKILKKFENLPRHKPHGVNIDIQGKSSDKYKIRIEGARSNDQLTNIVNFVNVLIYLYVETYLYRIKERQALLDKLRGLNNIAKRRYKVSDFIFYDEDVKEIKRITKLDKTRLGFKPEKGQDQWSRLCQNSGLKIRRPQQYNNKNIEELIKSGYKLNKKNGQFEKHAIIREAGKKKDVILKTIKLKGYNEKGDNIDEEVMYGCDPKINGAYYYIGFLTKGKNPFGHCMPCCFKKDPLVSMNENKKNFFEKCIGQTETTDKMETGKNKLYILQDTNKIIEDRTGFLPKYLDIYLNEIPNHDKKIKNHLLTQSISGYFFKQGIKSCESPFLESICIAFNITYDKLIKKLVEILENDNGEQIFTSLNNGDIRTQFETREEYIKFIKKTKNIDYDMISELLRIPDVLSKGGVNIVVFVKTYYITKHAKGEKIKEDFYISEIISENKKLNLNENSKTILLLKDEKIYYNIVMWKKLGEKEPANIYTTFDGNHEVLKNITDFYTKSNTQLIQFGSLMEPSYVIYEKMADKIKYQIIDARNKCIYFVSKSNLLIPVLQSTSLYNVKIVSGTLKYIKSFDETINEIKKIKFIKANGIFYDSKTEEEMKVIAITTDQHGTIPIIPENITIRKIDELGLIKEDKPLYDIIDNEINNYKFITDERIRSVNLDKYMMESYELFRYEFSDFINKLDNNKMKENIIKILNGDKSNDIKSKITKLIYKITDETFLPLYEKSIEEKIGGSKLVHKTTNIPDLDNYETKNERDLCEVFKSKEQCINKHCSWNHNECKLGITSYMLVIFVNKLVNELLNNEMKKMELLQIGEYSVNDIVNRNVFAKHENQAIFKSTSLTIKQTIDELFGKEHTPIIGKKKIDKLSEVALYQQLNIQNPMIDMESMYIQNIIPNQFSILRAYVNGYFWIKHPFHDVDTINDANSRNLGFCSNLQTDYMNYLKGLIIKSLNKIDMEEINKYLKENIKDYILKIWKNSNTITNGIIELYILNIIQGVQINIVDENLKILYTFKDGKIMEGGQKIDDKSINIQYYFAVNKEIPSNIKILYIK
jgi:hypothetical protein